MAYMGNTLAYGMYAGNDLSRREFDLVVAVYSRADYVGCASTQRSMAGAVVVLSQRQGSVSRPTPEAEIVAMGTAIRVVTIPLLSLVEDVSGTKRVSVCGASQAMLSVIEDRP